MHGLRQALSDCLCPSIPWSEMEPLQEGGNGNLHCARTAYSEPLSSVGFGSNPYAGGMGAALVLSIAGRMGKKPEGIN